MNTLHFSFDDNDQIITSIADDREHVRNLFANSGQLPFLMVPVGAKHYSCLDLIDRGWSLEQIERQALNHVA